MPARIVAFCVLFLAVLSARASHELMGGKLEYRFRTEDSLELILTLYGFCGIHSMPGDVWYDQPQKVRIDHGNDSSIIFLPLCNKYLNPDLCPDTVSRCLNGILLTAQVYVYKKVIYIKSLNACQLKFSWWESATPIVFDRYLTMIGAGNPFAATHPYLYAFLDYCNVKTPNSPIFRNKFPDYIGYNKNLTFNYGITTDAPEDDSIYFEFTEPLTLGGSSISYNGLYSPEKPLRFLGFPNASSALPAGFHIDHQCGKIAFRPVSNFENTVFVVKASRFVKRNGIAYKVSEVMYEHLVIVGDTNAPKYYFARPQVVDGNACIGKSAYGEISCGTNKPLQESVKTVCTNDSILLASEYDPGYLYQWKKNNSDIPGANSNTFWAKDTGYFTLTIINSFTGCEKTSQATYVKFFDGITPIITYDSSRRYCIGDTAFLQRENKHYSFMLWKQNGQSYSDDTALVFPVTQTGVYTLHVINNIGCRVSSNPLKITINLPDTTRMLGHIKTAHCGAFTDTLRSLKPLNQYNWQKPVASTADNFIINSPGNYYLSGIDTNNCPVEDSVEVVQHPLLVVNLGNDTGICYSAVLNKTLANIGQLANGLRYLWNNNPADTFDTYSVTDSGLYFVLVTDSNGCKSSDSIKITRYNEIKINLGSDTTICFDAVVNKIVTATPGLLPGIKYQWNIGDTTNQITVTDSGNYFVSLADTNSCTYSDTLKITRTPGIKINLGSDTTYCPTAPINRVLSASVTYNPNYFYLWNNSATDTLHTYTAANEGGYFVHIKDINNCTAADTISLSRFPKINFSLGPDTTLCDAGSKIVNIDTDFLNPVWSTGANTYAITVSNDGSYWVKASDTNLCPLADTIQIAFKFTPEISLPDTALCERDFITLEVQAGHTRYIWSNGEKNNIAAIKDTGAVWVRAINECGDDRADAWIKGCRYDPPVIFIPNAFTPNGDWLNNTFNIYTENIRRFDLKIFNRWGQLIFHSKNLDTPWDGTYDGQPVPQETYMYIISVMGLNNRLYTFYGNITVLR